ncbi:hypothetical protein EON65_36975, partial [archaeon]
TYQPTVGPSSQPTRRPSVQPSYQPTLQPTSHPTVASSAESFGLFAWFLVSLGILTLLCSHCLLIIMFASCPREHDSYFYTLFSLPCSMIWADSLLRGQDKRCGVKTNDEFVVKLLEST